MLFYDTGGGYTQLVQWWRRLAPRLLPIAAAAAALAAGCRPVAVQEGEVTVADVSARRPRGGPLDILGIGTQREDGRIVLRSTGATVPRGATATVGVMGPGIEEGTGFAMVGLGFQIRILRYAVTEGGGIEPMPAAVLSIEIPAEARPGLYSIVAVRGAEYAIFSGGLEIQ